MPLNNINNLSNFFAIGINYRKTDAGLRSQFAITHAQYINILNNAQLQNLKELFVVSTCNRTEIYGFAKDPAQLIELLCSETIGSATTFEQICYSKNGKEAIQHLYHVAAGLDSQLLGDYEIIGQLKTAIRVAKEKGFIKIFIQRLINSVLQCSRSIKNNTQLSQGTTSVSFAVIQYLRENVKEVKDKKILLLGIGKLGSTTGKNLTNYLGTTNITLINRTVEKAIRLASFLKINYALPEEMQLQIQQSDIIIVATHSVTPLILQSDVDGFGEKLILDLSIPFNVEPCIKDLSNIKLVDVDQLSKIKDETLQKRLADIPKAKAIIEEHRTEFMTWLLMRKNVPVLKQVKLKLREIHRNPLFISPTGFKPNTIDTDIKIQRILNGMVSKMNAENQKGCYYIDAINEFIADGIHESV